jgi:hypothetical protein
MADLTVRCVRCAREVSVDDDEFLEWQAIHDGGPDSDKVICAGCLTGRELHQIDDEMAQAEADAVGLSPTPPNSQTHQEAQSAPCWPGLIGPKSGRPPGRA